MVRPRTRLLAATVAACICAAALAASASAELGPAVAGSPANGSITQATSAQFTFVYNGSWTPLDYTCYVDGSVVDPCSSPVSMNSLSEGNHSFGVSMFSMVEQEICTFPGDPCITWQEPSDTDTSTVNFTIDRTPPVISFTGGPQTGDTLTTSDTFFSMFNEPGSTLMCSLDGAAAAECGDSFAAVELANGTHTFTISSTDAAGNTSSQTRTFSVQVQAAQSPAESPPASIPAKPAARVKCNKLRVKRRGRVLRTRSGKIRYKHVCKTISVGSH